jgi:hypothetical protein
MGKKTMAGVDNLVPINQRTKQEIREIGRKGGKATAETYRRRKTYREIFEAIGVQKTALERAAKLKQSFPEVDIKEVSNDLAVALSMFDLAIHGDVSAATFIRDTKGEKPKERFEGELKTNTLPNIEIVEDENGK